MLPLIVQVLHLARFLAQPEDQTCGARLNGRLAAFSATAFAGAAKAGVWAALALLAGLGLAQLH